MCRVLIYMGRQSVRLSELIIEPDNSLVKQSLAPIQMMGRMNLAGFGFAAWAKGGREGGEPYLYKTKSLPFYDANLYRLAKRVEAKCLLAHVRGVPYSDSEIVNEENVHPFLFNGYTLALAHNGSLPDIGYLKRELIKVIKPELFVKIRGGCDSEWIYALFLSLLKDPTAYVPLEEAKEAVLEALRVIKRVRRSLRVETVSPINLFITNGDYAIVTRFVFDFGKNIQLAVKGHIIYQSLWYTYGEEYGFFDDRYYIRGASARKNVIFASEPLTTDLTTWIEAPEYSMTTAAFCDGEIVIDTMDLVV